MRPPGRHLDPPTGSRAPTGRSTLPVDAEILGVDFGQRRIGLARATPAGGVAGPWKTIDVRGREHALRELARLVEEGRFALVVFGLPLTSDGAEGSAARRIRRIGRTLGRRAGVSVAFQDEHLSTREAESRRNVGRGRIDTFAAAVILQDYLDSRGGRP